MPDSTGSVAARVGPVIDSNVHLSDQRGNPVFWLSDRTMLRDMLGDYDCDRTSRCERTTLAEPTRDPRV